MKAANRIRLGTTTQAFAREAVYELPDGLETESSEHYEVIRKRVLFEDVLLVTYHRETGVWFVILNAFIGVFFLFLGVLIVNAQRTGNAFWYALPWIVMALPFLIAASLRAILGVDVVTTFGRRSKAILRFTFRKRRAREIYGHICAKVRQAQRALEREVAESAAAEVPQAPLPPEMLPPSELSG
jgi:hypothetical protein